MKAVFMVNANGFLHVGKNEMILDFGESSETLRVNTKELLRKIYRGERGVWIGKNWEIVPMQNESSALVCVITATATNNDCDRGVVYCEDLMEALSIIELVD